MMGSPGWPDGRRSDAIIASAGFHAIKPMDAPIAGDEISAAVDGAKAGAYMLCVTFCSGHSAWADSSV
jgi:hypothetical protein